MFSSLSLLLTLWTVVSMPTKVVGGRYSAIEGHDVMDSSHGATRRRADDERSYERHRQADRNKKADDERSYERHRQAISRRLRDNR